MNDIHIKYLLNYLGLGTKSELILFSANRFDSKNHQIKISGQFRWKDDIIDDNPQSYVWCVSINDFRITGALELINILKEKDLMDGDRIKCKEGELKEILYAMGWAQKGIEGAIEYLLDTEVLLIDEGAITSSYFVHF